jgi:hypothetical protein
VKRKTIAKRMRAKLQQVKEQLRTRRHDPVPLTGKWLKAVVQGYFNYHAVQGNLDRLRAFREHVSRHWRRSLLRRSQKHALTWDRFNRLLDRWLPIPRPLHPWPEQRFDAMIRDRSRMR